MNKYRVFLGRTEYYGKEFIIEAANKDEAIDKAWDMSGNWQKIEENEYIDECELISLRGIK